MKSSDRENARPGLRRARRRAGLSMSELARRLGLSTASVHHWEAGTRTPSDSILPLLAGELRLSVDDVLDLIDAVPVAAN